MPLASPRRSAGARSGPLAALARGRHQHGRQGRMAGRRLCRAALADGENTRKSTCEPAAASRRLGPRSDATLTSTMARGRIRRFGGQTPDQAHLNQPTPIPAGRNQGGNPLSRSPDAVQTNRATSWHVETPVDLVLSVESHGPWTGQSYSDHRASMTAYALRP